MRDPSRLQVDHPKLTVIQGDVLDAGAVANAMRGQDGVLCALGHKRFFYPTRILSEGTRNILGAMESHGVHRLVCESSLGIGDSSGRMGLYYTFFVIPVILPFYFWDKTRQERLIARSAVEWVIVRPGVLNNRAKRGEYRHGSQVGNFVWTVSISRADVADFMLDQVTDEAVRRTGVGGAFHAAVVAAVRAVGGPARCGVGLRGNNEAVTGMGVVQGRHDMERGAAARGRFAGALAGAEGIEIKATIPERQVAEALKRFRMTTGNDEERYIYFFDTPRLGLLRAGIIARARRVVGGDHDCTVKLRPVDPAKVAPKWRKYREFKIEADASEKGLVKSASFSMPVAKGLIKRVAAGKATIAKTPERAGKSNEQV